MKLLKVWVTIGVALTALGVLTGCGSHEAGGNPTQPTTKTNTDSRSNKTSSSVLSNRTTNVLSTGNNATSKTSANSVAHSTQGSNTTSITTMPKPLMWHTLSPNGNKTIKTSYGMISFSTQEITKEDVSVFLSSSGVKRIIYKSHTSNFQQFDGWQLDGPYLALRFGFPPSTNPSTGDYGFQDVVIALNTRNVLLDEPSSLQSIDYLTNPFFVQSVANTVDGTPKSFVTVTNLHLGQDISFELSPNTLGLGVVSGTSLYYSIENGTKHRVVSIVLPKTGWQPLSETKWNPIQLVAPNS